MALVRRMSVVEGVKSPILRMSQLVQWAERHTEINVPREREFAVKNYIEIKSRLKALNT